MSDSEYKLKQLQACIGEKKLKQLGLIPCLTCREILTQVMNVSLPTDLENKPFFTSDEMATINQTILAATKGSLNNIPLETTFNDLHTDSVQDETSDPIDKPDTSMNTDTINDAQTSDLSSSDTSLNLPPELLSDLANTSVESDKEFVSKLLSILNHSHHISQDDLGIGYIYTPPTVPPISNALCCCECGRLYSVITHPDLKLLPLPVYLSETEYEMLKGIYVDIFL